MSDYQGNIVIKNPATPTGPNPITGRAPGVWKLNEVAYWLKQGVWPDASADAYWPYVSMLLSTTSLNGAQNNTFLDSSTNNFTITRNGNTTQGSFSPYGTRWSNYFDGSGDYLQTPDNAAFAFGTGDYTIEAWVFPTSIRNGENLIYATEVTGGTTFGYNQTQVWIGARNTAFDLMVNSALPLNQWSHVAASRQSGTVRIFVNGVLAGSGTVTRSCPQGTGAVGDYPGLTGNGAIGYLSDVRVVKGTAVYTSNFTPTTAPLTAITNTSLLTCQSNRFRDASTNNFTITRNGDVRVSPFSPYAPTAPYSAAANGGSMYFDGSGDYLSLPTAAGVIGTGDFTVEAWFKSNVSTAPTHCPIIANYEANSNGSWAVKASAGSNQCLSFAYYNSGWNDLNTSLNISSDLAWHHVAVTRSGTTLRIYADGVLINSWTVTASLGGNGYTLQIGRIANDDAYINGFISDARLAVGTALYTGSTYTVPTAPLTAISGTKFLVGGRNAAIFDSAADNDLETVGNAQISTVQSKFGGSSVYFDGNGDWIDIPNNPVNFLGSGDFTVEFWVYGNSWSTLPVLLEYGRQGASNTPGLEFYVSTSGGKLDVYGGSTTGTLLASYSNLPTTTWTHVALTRASGSNRLFINGVQSGTATTDTANYNQAFIRIGAFVNGSNSLNGYIDDLRVTKGVARYTANFTPPTAAFPVY